jgi:antirestriction protein ArdC
MYWETLLHELAHFCEVRLGWDHRQEGYAMGELVAEISSCMTATELGIPQGEEIENHADYLKVWLAAMKADSSFVFKAATQASKVTDFILGFAKTNAQAVLVRD